MQSFEEFMDEYSREISAAYWEEEAEMEAGIHPTQVEERIKNSLNKNNIKYKRITFLNWLNNGCVEATLDNGNSIIFNYISNVIL